MGDEPTSAAVRVGTVSVKAPLHAEPVALTPTTGGINGQAPSAPARHAGVMCRLEVATLERLGADNLAHGHWEGCAMVVRLAHDDLPAPGATLHLHCPADAWHYFDSQSGTRVEI